MLQSQRPLYEQYLIQICSTHGIPRCYFNTQCLFGQTPTGAPVTLIDWSLSSAARGRPRGPQVWEDLKVGWSQVWSGFDPRHADWWRHDWPRAIIAQCPCKTNRGVSVAGDYDTNYQCTQTQIMTRQYVLGKPCYSLIRAGLYHSM